MAQVGGGAQSDGELIERIAVGDRAAFEELYGRYARAVLGHALTYGMAVRTVWRQGNLSVSVRPRTWTRRRPS
jgi:hypothetical protein